MNYHVQEQIELMLVNYIKELNIFGYNFKYVPVNQWNTTNICINKYFENQIIGTGHCASISLLLSHLIINFSDNPRDIYKTFSDFSDDETVFIIKEYSSGFYNILKKENRLHHEELYSKEFNNLNLPKTDSENIDKKNTDMLIQVEI
jgi:hypothetical protein